MKKLKIDQIKETDMKRSPNNAIAQEFKSFIDLSYVA
jgi:hypothetical protein